MYIKQNSQIFSVVLQVCQYQRKMDERKMDKGEANELFRFGTNGSKVL
jgi:hypothetical protein